MEYALLIVIEYVKSTELAVYQYVTDVSCDEMSLKIMIEREVRVHSAALVLSFVGSYSLAVQLLLTR